MNKIRYFCIEPILSIRIDQFISLSLNINVNKFKNKHEFLSDILRNEILNLMNYL